MEPIAADLSGSPGGQVHASSKGLEEQFGGPLVSVIIPCYNQGRFVGEAIESVLAQTYPRVELIVVDDDSPDDTAAIVGRYDSVKYLYQDHKRVPAARNLGLSASGGAFVMFLDADDRLTSNAVAAHLHCFAEHPDAGFVVGDIDRIHEDGSFEFAPRWPVLTSNFYEELLKANHVANTIAVMFRRAALEELGGFDTSTNGAEDYELLLRTARSFPSAHHLTVVAHYRRYATSSSRRGVRLLRAMRNILRSQRPFIAGNHRLEAASRQGGAYWRDHFGVTAMKEFRSHLRRGDLLGALGTFAALLYYVRGRLLLFPWTYRRRLLAVGARFLREHLRFGRIHHPAEHTSS
ncbi:hypothetical protein BH18VER1_BH18VER1_16400 [soil metagenome]